MVAWRQLKGYYCRCAKCCFAMSVIREASLVGYAALEDIEIGERVAETFARLEKKDAMACSWMMVVGK